MKYAVVGAGAMGLRYGLLLQDAGLEVDFVEPTKESLDVIRKQGNKVYRSIDHKDRRLIPVSIYSPEDYEGNPDIWIFFMKQMQLEDTLKRLAPKFKEGQVALGAMNGMGHLEKLQKYFSDDRIIGGTAMIATILNDFGDVDFIGSCASVYANLCEEPTETLDQVLKDFEKAGLEPQYSDNLMGTVLTKLTFNSVENSIATMFQARLGQLIQYDDFLEDIARPMVEEAYAAAHAAGIELIESPARMLKSMDLVSRVKSPDHFPSMYQDFVKGRPTEVDYINGYLVSLAEEHGLKAPTQKFVTHLVHLSEKLRDFDPPVNKLAR
ncbi:ketopantoate reductase family protein [Streptococcaceae bacterium ESL0687]|nr:ketopantoate reductase family protein [Streptococcaceae bacterium ESL0687]